MTVCSRCGTEKPIDNFLSHKGYKNGKSSWCKKCHRQRTAQWKKDNPDKTANGRLLHKFNITLEQYNDLLIAQGGVCAICCRMETIEIKTKTRRLAVDHDRSCCDGEKSCGNCIRGILCQSCNTALGLFDDDISRMEKAIQYLNNTKKERA